MTVPSASPDSPRQPCGCSCHEDHPDIFCCVACLNRHGVSVASFHGTLSQGEPAPSSPSPETAEPSKVQLREAFIAGVWWAERAPSGSDIRAEAESRFPENYRPTGYVSAVEEVKRLSVSVSRLEEENQRLSRENERVSAKAQYLDGAYGRMCERLQKCAHEHRLGSPGDAIDEIVVASVTELVAQVQALSEALRQMRERKDGAYYERNCVVAALSKVFPAVMATTEIEGWDPEWRWCVYITLPTGQVSWHVHEDHTDLFAHLEVELESPWDGHDTPEKYRRLAALSSLSPEPPRKEGT
jgi:hypothetical protein